jgi:hypothetical protein
MKRKSKPKKTSFGVGYTKPNSSFPNVRRSAMNKKVEPKPNTQIMGFNDSTPSR